MSPALPSLGLVLRTVAASLACFVAYSGYVAWLIRDGAVPLVFLYDQNVQDVAIGQGLITREQLGRNLRSFIVASYAILLAGLAVVTLVVNHTRGFFGFWWQTTLYVWLWNAYDHFVIDTLWVGHTSAWQIPGAEGWDYIPKGSKSKKRMKTALAAPVIATVIAALASVVLG